MRGGEETRKPPLIYLQRMAPTKSLRLWNPCAVVHQSSTTGPTWPKRSGTSNLDTKFLLSPKRQASPDGGRRSLLFRRDCKRSSTEFFSYLSMLAVVADHSGSGGTKSRTDRGLWFRKRVCYNGRPIRYCRLWN